MAINIKIQPHPNEEKKNKANIEKQQQQMCLSCLRVKCESLDEDVPWSVLRGCSSVTLPLILAKEVTDG